MQKQKSHHNKPHVPVLARYVLKLLAPQSGESYLDLTAGFGGHAELVLERTLAPNKATLVDRDERAIEYLKARFDPKVRIMHNDFATAAQQLRVANEQFDLLLVDLGVSSPQFDEAERGFSFQHTAPLDMRMDARQTMTAADIVNNWSESELANVIKDYGEEPRADKIAAAIVETRPIDTTTQLADVITTVISGKGKTHPATRTFQALRIAVNDELEQLDALLASLPDLLKPGGRVAIISFHSLEDRRIKNFIKAHADSAYDATLKNLTKRPISGATDDVHNPRARSAKLRAAAKIKTNI